MTMLNVQLKTAFIVLLASYTFSSCTTVDIYEKTVPIPGHKWLNNYRPEFSFEIKDTSVPYNIYFVIRHTEKYNYNNIYINLISKQPGADSIIKQQKDIPLATNEKGWLGTGMDDIYEQRWNLSSSQGSYFSKAGVYTFSIEQIMRENPLEHVMNVGLRIEKKPL
jgi:gliding motility-associated lipoprotein GldH